MIEVTLSTLTGARPHVAVAAVAHFADASSHFAAAAAAAVAAAAASPFSLSLAPSLFQSL